MTDDSDIDDRLRVVQETLTASVERVFASDDWRAALAAAAKFHNYSFDNVLLIYAQHQVAFAAGRVEAPEPTMVAGYRQWQAMGRQVRGGQVGYKIQRPNRVQWREVQEPGSREWRRLSRGETPRAGATVRQRSRLNDKRPFDLATVFDISQTDGEPIPELPAPILLEGLAPDGLWPGLSEQVRAAGFTLQDSPSARQLGGANGVTNWQAVTVTVRADMHDAARAKTLAHELGHVLMHDPRRDDGTIDMAAAMATTRGVKEVEAESVAFLIGAAHGMDTADYSLPYISTWASRDEGLATVRQVGTRVVSTARKVLDQLPTEQWGSGQPPGVREHSQQQSLNRSAAAARSRVRSSRRSAVAVGR